MSPVVLLRWRKTYPLLSGSIKAQENENEAGKDRLDEGSLHIGVQAKGGAAGRGWAEYRGSSRHFGNCKVLDHL